LVIEFFQPYIWPHKVQYLIEMLSRKVEGIDPAKPWQPLDFLPNQKFREGATFYDKSVFCDLEIDNTRTISQSPKLSEYFS